MAENSKIEWTDHTWNPWIGCTKISPGCKHCYAETMDRRALWDNQTHWGPLAPRRRTSESNWKKPLAWNKQDWLECVNCGWRGAERQAIKAPKDLCPECEGETMPTRQRVFCASLADVFEDNDQLIDWRVDLFDLIKVTPNLDWLILTKRPEVARQFFDLCPGLLKGNIWLGTSVENQEQADKRIPVLLNISVRIKFLSCEPLLGPVDLLPWLGCYVCGGSGDACAPTFTDSNFEDFDFQECPVCGGRGYNPQISWVIVGGESGPGARPCAIEWVGNIVAQCKQAGVPVFVKQMGDNPTWDGDSFKRHLGPKGKDITRWPEYIQIQEWPQPIPLE